MTMYGPPLMPGPTEDTVNNKFTGKERDAETGLDFFGARYFNDAQGRFTNPDPLGPNMLRVINPQRWNMYAYVVNNPLAYTDPDGRDAIAVNFPAEVPVGGHTGIIVVHLDGSAMYARFGPEGGTQAFGPGEVVTQPLSAVQFQSNHLPTDASYAQLAKEVAAVEGQPVSAPGFNYFRTSEADTNSLQLWMDQMQALSDAGKAPEYRFNTQNCASFVLRVC
jgi:RHS repeat-associated protein